MAGTRHDDAPHTDTGLIKRGEESDRLGRRIDYVVMGAVNEQKARLVVG